MLAGVLPSYFPLKENTSRHITSTYIDITFILHSLKKQFNNWIIFSRNFNKISFVNWTNQNGKILKNVLQFQYENIPNQELNGYTEQ